MHKNVKEIFLLIVLIFLTGILSSILFGLLYSSVSESTEFSPKMYLINGFISQIVVFLGTFFMFLRLTKQSFKEVIWIDKISSKWLLISVATLLISFVIVIGLNYINGLLEYLFPNNSAVSYNYEITEQQLSVIKESNWGVYTTVFILGLLPAVCEELIFRGALLGSIYKFTQNKNGAILFSALIFSFLHFQVLSILPMIFIGLVLGYVYTRSKNILYSMVIHFLFNSIQILIIYYS